MTDHTPPQAVIYCRVSDAKQLREGDGLASQEIRCREYAKYKGYEVILAILKELWEEKRARAASLAKKAIKGLGQLDRKASQIMERLLATSTPALITAYEGDGL